MNKMKLKIQREPTMYKRQEVFIGIGALINKSTFQENGHKKGNACWKVGAELNCYSILF